MHKPKNIWSDWSDGENDAQWRKGTQECLGNSVHCHLYHKMKRFAQFPFKDLYKVNNGRIKVNNGLITKPFYFVIITYRRNKNNLFTFWQNSLNATFTPCIFLALWECGLPVIIWPHHLMPGQPNPFSGQSHEVPLKRKKKNPPPKKVFT